MHRLCSTLALAALIPACIISEGESPTCEGKCDSPIDECSAPEYGDGTCDLDLACEAPDIDCFVTFDSDAEAVEWFAGFEKLLAEEQGRPPRPLLSGSDPRFARMRALLDEGWDSYKEHIPVGELGAHRVGLVVVEDPTVNAFVVPDVSLEQVGLTVMVQTGLLELGGTDAELLGLVMHELEHAVGIHVLPGRKEELLRAYQVLPGEPEPFGFEQQNDPDLAEALELLIATGREVGLQPHEELNGLPLFTGQYFQTLELIRQGAIADNPEGCGDAQAGHELFIEFLAGHFRTLDGALVLGEDADSLDFVTSEYARTLREDCVGDSPATLIDVLAAQRGTTPDEIRQSLGAHDLALIDGAHMVDGLTAIGLDRYQRIGTLDEVLLEETGGGIASLRYFSTEEAADDVTVGILEGAGVAPDGLASFLLLALLGPEDRAACEAIIESGEMPPYGVDLTDDHHATCWRAWHVRELAARETGYAPAPGRAIERPRLRARLRDLGPPSSLPRRERLEDYVPDCFSP